MLPSYITQSRAVFLFYGSFLTIQVFVFVNLITAVVYFEFQLKAGEDVFESFISKRIALILGFKLLALSEAVSDVHQGGHARARHSMRSVDGLTELLEPTITSKKDWANVAKSVERGGALLTTLLSPRATLQVAPEPRPLQGEDGAALPGVPEGGVIVADTAAATAESDGRRVNKKKSGPASAHQLFKRGKSAKVLQRTWWSFKEKRLQGTMKQQGEQAVTVDKETFAKMVRAMQSNQFLPERSVGASKTKQQRGVCQCCVKRAKSKFKLKLLWGCCRRGGGGGGGGGRTNGGLESEDEEEAAMAGFADLWAVSAGENGRIDALEFIALLTQLEETWRAARIVQESVDASCSRRCCTGGVLRQLRPCIAHSSFTSTVDLLVGANVLLMLLKVIVRGAIDDPCAPLSRVIFVTSIVEAAFSIIFGLEMIVKILAIGVVGYVGTRGHLFDGATVILSVSSQSAMLAVRAAFASQSGADCSPGIGLSALRVATALRAVRLIRFFMHLKTTRRCVALHLPLCARLLLLSLSPRCTLHATLLMLASYP